MPVSREEHLRRRRAFYQANKERLQRDARIRAAQRREEDPETVRQALAEWRAKNLNRARELARKSHALRLRDPEKLAQKRLHGILASAVRTGTGSAFAHGAEFLVWLRPEALEIFGRDVQIDHLRPLNAFNLADEGQKIAANSALNVWWLPRRANRMKGRRPPTEAELRLHSELLSLFLLWKSNSTTRCPAGTTPTPHQVCSPRKPAHISRKKTEILKRLKQELFSTRLLRPETSPSSKTKSR